MGLALSLGQYMDPRIYRIAPEYRRCAIYAMIGSGLLGVGAWWVGQVLPPQRDPWATAAVCAVFAAISSAMIVPLRWRLRVDGSGIARRRLFGWDLWPWDDFASGRVEKRHPITLVDPGRPWWCRKLNLAYIAHPEFGDLIRLVNEHYRMPDPPTLPDSLRIHYGFRLTIEFDWREIRLSVRGEPFHFPWTEVQRLHIRRIDPLRRDFVSMQLSLPGHEIEFKLITTDQGVTVASWKGAEVGELNEFLLAHVPADRIDVDIVGDRPGRAVDVQKLLTTARKTQRDLRIASLVSGFLLAAIVAWSVFALGLVRALCIAGTFGILSLIPWFVRRENSKSIEVLETQLAELQAERPQSRCVSSSVRCDAPEV